MGTRSDRARYNIVKREGSGCWCATNNTKENFVQASSPMPLVYHVVSTIGCPSVDNRFTTYKILYTLNGFDWLYYNNGVNFSGNPSKTSIINNTFDPFIARSIRILPITWYSGVCSRAEFYVSRLFYDPIPPRSGGLVWISAIKSGFNIIFSSIYDPEFGDSASILDFRSLGNTNSWCAAFYDLNQYIAISSYSPVIWHRVSVQGRTQGSCTSRVSSFRVSYTLDGIVWNDYQNKLVIIGSFDSSTVISYDFIPSFIAITIKIHPIEWVSCLCTKVEAYFSKI